MKSLRILLTGATGFIGTNFILNLHEKYQITALVRKSSDTSKIEKYCEIYRFDENERDLSAFESLFNKYKFDGIVHLAALAPTAQRPQSKLDDLLNSNISFGTKLLEASKDKIRFFIHVSTSACYCNSLAYRPATLYGATKKAFEDIMSFYALDNEGIVYTNLLFFNAYGPNDKTNSTRLFSLLDRAAKSGEVLEMSDGAQIVDYSHVFDVVAAFACLIELCLKEPEFAKNKIFALKGAERMSLKELVSLYEKTTNQRLHIKWGAKKRRKFEILNPWQGGESLPNFTPTISLERGFKMLINDTLTQNQAQAKNATGGGGLNI